MSSTPRQSSNVATQAQKVFIVALAMFAVAGLLVGFTVGKFNKAPKSTVTPNTPQAHVVATATATPTKVIPTPTADVANVGISCPEDLKYSTPAKADGTTSYTASVQVKDKSIASAAGTCGKGKPLLVPNLTCKLWLTQDLDSINTLEKTSGDILRAANFQTPFPKEEQGALIFDEATPQVQPCSQTGETSWKYKIAATVKPGDYYIAMIVDWQGKRYNYNARLLTIKGA